MRTLFLLGMFFCNFSECFAITKSEFNCIVKSTYLEARSEDKLNWLRVANVAYNRKIHFQEYNFGAKSQHLCDIVQSKEYTSAKLLKTPIREPEVYAAIETALQKHNWFNIHNALYFSTLKGKMQYRGQYVTSQNTSDRLRNNRNRQSRPANPIGSNRSSRQH